MTTNTTKINFAEIQANDLIRITIEDCGIGNALVLTKDKHFMTINIDRDTFIPCYDCQSLGSSLMDVHEDEIHEIILINRKEENKMKKTNIHAEGYLRKEDIRKELENFGVSIDKTGDHMGKMFADASKSGISFQKYSDNVFRLATALAVTTLYCSLYSFFLLNSFSQRR